MEKKTFRNCRFYRSGDVLFTDMEVFKGQGNDTYLASVMDLYDRKIIGWAYGKNITSELATQAVKNACLNIPDTTGIVLHSDLGSQYTSEEFEKYLQEIGRAHV